jgi:uncharacterized protein YbaR (Trm112 family)
MVRVVKHEWHQHDRQYYFDFDEDILSEIYPDYDEDEIANLLEQLENGEADIEEVINDAYNNDIDLDWEFGYDDCWTDRKGGYDVTYEMDNDYEGETPREELPHTRKCTKCKWTGMSYDTSTIYLREDGSVIEDYWEDNNDEEMHSSKDVCPMCDSDVELTEAGVKDEQERAERMARWAEESEEFEDESEEIPEHAECTSCEWTGPEADTLTIEGVMCCPECREPVFTYEQVQENRVLELNEALEELKLEFENLLASEEETNHSADFSCIQCDWKGKIDETIENKNGECVCPDCGEPVEAEAWPFDDEEHKNVK